MSHDPKKYVPEWDQFTTDPPVPDVTLGDTRPIMTFYRNCVIEKFKPLQRMKRRRGWQRKNVERNRWVGRPVTMEDAMAQAEAAGSRAVFA